MFRHNEKNEVIDVSLIDWQISRYASPVCDIVYYLFCCTDKELRDKHYDSWLKAYHESLTTLLNKWVFLLKLYKNGVFLLKFGLFYSNMF